MARFPHFCIGSRGDGPSGKGGFRARAALPLAGSGWACATFRRCPSGEQHHPVRGRTAARARQRISGRESWPDARERRPQFPVHPRRRVWSSRHAGARPPAGARSRVGRRGPLRADRRRTPRIRRRRRGRSGCAVARLPGEYARGRTNSVRPACAGRGGSRRIGPVVLARRCARNITGRRRRRVAKRSWIAAGGVPGGLDRRTAFRELARLRGRGDRQGTLPRELAVFGGRARKRVFGLAGGDFRLAVPPLGHWPHALREPSERHDPEPRHRCRPEGNAGDRVQLQWCRLS